MEKFDKQEIIDDSIDRYKETGDMKFRDQVLYLFEPYIQKYVSICKGSSIIDLSNEDTLKFLRLFMTDAERANEFTCKAAGPKYIFMIKKIMISWETLEVYNELIVNFLELLEKYRPMIANHTQEKARISFAHYIIVNLRYRIKEMIIRIGKDAMSNLSSLGYDGISNLKSPHVEPDNPTTIDLNWVWNDTANDIFSSLSDSDRYILLLRNDGISLDEMALITGLHRLTLHARFKKIREKLEDLI